VCARHGKPLCHTLQHHTLRSPALPSRKRVYKRLFSCILSAPSLPSCPPWAAHLIASHPPCIGPRAPPYLRAAPQCQSAAMPLLRQRPPTLFGEPSLHGSSSSFLCSGVLLIQLLLCGTKPSTSPTLPSTTTAAPLVAAPSHCHA
jgi:hypothetical protein